MRVISHSKSPAPPAAVVRDEVVPICIIACKCMLVAWLAELGGNTIEGRKAKEQRLQESRKRARDDETEEQSEEF